MAESYTVEKNGAVLYTIAGGYDGRELVDKEKLTQAVENALKSEQSLSAPLNVKTTPMARKVINMTEQTHWIDVNLTEKKVKLFIGDVMQKEFSVGIGKPTTPTIQGAFVVDRKYTKKDMTSGGPKDHPDYYLIKDVPWISFFHKNYGLHGAPWLKEGGVEISHGCINMFVNDAKEVYDFAPLGTLVVVHR
jgi:lipoprotein-anchoring transpeptidase ErfK/SrfK